MRILALRLFLVLCWWWPTLFLLHGDTADQHHHHGYPGHVNVVVEAFVFQRQVQHRHHLITPRKHRGGSSSKNNNNNSWSKYNQLNYADHQQQHVRKLQQHVTAAAVAGGRRFRLFPWWSITRPKKVVWAMLWAVLLYSLLGSSRPVQAKSSTSSSSSATATSIVLSSSSSSSSSLAQPPSDQQNPLDTVEEEEAPSSWSLRTSPSVLCYAANVEDSRVELVSSSRTRDAPQQQQQQYEPIEEEDERMMGLYIPSSLMTEPWTTEVSSASDDDLAFYRDTVLVDRQTSSTTQQQRWSKSTKSPTSTPTRRTQQERPKKQSSGLNPFRSGRTQATPTTGLFHRTPKSKQQQKQKQQIQQQSHKKKTTGSRSCSSPSREDPWPLSPVRIVTGTGIVLVAAGAGVLMGQKVDPPAPLGSSTNSTTTGNSNNNNNNFWSPAATAAGTTTTGGGNIRSFAASLLQEPPPTASSWGDDRSSSKVDENDDDSQLLGNDGSWRRPVNTTTERAGRLINDWVGLSRDVTDRLRAIRQQEQDMTKARRQERRKDERDRQVLSALDDEDDEEGEGGGIDSRQNLDTNDDDITSGPLFFATRSPTTLSPRTPTTPSPSSLSTKYLERRSAGQSLTDKNVRDEFKRTPIAPSPRTPTAPSLSSLSTKYLERSSAGQSVPDTVLDEFIRNDQDDYDDEVVAATFPESTAAATDVFVELAPPTPAQQPPLWTETRWPESSSFSSSPSSSSSDIQWKQEQQQPPRPLQSTPPAPMQQQSPPPPVRKVTWLPSMEPKHIRARQQPKMASEEQKLQLKYGSMSLRDRAYQILVDLGMIEDPSNGSSYDD